LSEGEGTGVYRDLTTLLAGLPDLDVAAMHAFADAVSGRGDDDAWVGFTDMLAAWLNRRVRGEAEPVDGARLASAVSAAPLERWAEVWETLRRLTEQTDELNLDRKRTVLSILMSLSRATRM
jgi:DNA polymerase-3 subunit delta'